MKDKEDLKSWKWGKVAYVIQEASNTSFVVVGLRAPRPHHGQPLHTGSFMEIHLGNMGWIRHTQTAVWHETHFSPLSKLSVHHHYKTATPMTAVDFLLILQQQRQKMNSIHKQIRWRSVSLKYYQVNFSNAEIPCIITVAWWQADLCCKTYIYKNKGVSVFYLSNQQYKMAYLFLAMSLSYICTDI